MQRRILQFVMAIGVGATGLMSGNAVADGANPLLASSCGNDQAFYATALPWPGDRAFAVKPAALADPGFFGLPQATPACTTAEHPPIAVSPPTP